MELAWELKKNKGLGFVERPRCQGEQEAAALKERMTEETRVMMAVRTPSFQRRSWIQCLDLEVRLLHVATLVDPLTTMCIYFQHLPAEDAAKAELSLYTRFVLGSQEFDGGDRKVAFVALRVQSGRRRCQRSNL